MQSASIPNQRGFNMKFSNKSIVLGFVSDSTFVDDYILLEDETFNKLLDKHSTDIEEAVKVLTEYVSNNY